MGMYAMKYLHSYQPGIGYDVDMIESSLKLSTSFSQLLCTFSLTVVLLYGCDANEKKSGEGESEGDSPLQSFAG